MRHIVISDTHAPQTLQAAYEHAKGILPSAQPDAIVLNGDLLGIFSMGRSTAHEGPLTEKEKLAYLAAAAPQFLAKLQETQQLTPELALAYVAERYDWCYDAIKRFTTLHPTIFNLGNHESKEHFLVFQELPFLIGQQAPRLPDEALKRIFTLFELKLHALEAHGNFTYLRHRPLLVDGTLILGIPGESHATTGPEPAAAIQEAKTEELIALATPILDQAERLIIYNHTQGNYDQRTGNFQPASPALKRFLAALPPGITQRVWVQSHNHWNYTQHLHTNDIHYILNNAGLHKGIYNLIDYGDEARAEVRVLDLDPQRPHGTPVKQGAPGPITSDIDIAKRHYDNHLDIYLRRKTSVFDELH